MALVIKDRVRETTSSTGTGTLTLGGPYSGFQGFSVIGDGNTTYYAISDPNTGDWEVGIGTYTLSGNTLSRDTVLASTNSGSLVIFSVGTKDVICTQPSERAVYVVGTNVVAANSATVPNSLLANSSITVGSTTFNLGDTSTTLAGLSSVTSTALVGALTGTVGATSPTTGAFTTMTASSDSSFTSTGALAISNGTTAQRPGSPAVGMLRYNSTIGEFEGYSGASPSWKSVGGSAISNDTSTASNLYPLFAAATTGTAQNVYTSNAQYLFKPSTGELSVKAPRASNGILVNSATVTSDYTIASGDNGLSAGPVSVDSGVTVTVSSGSVWTVV